MINVIARASDTVFGIKVYGIALIVAATILAFLAPAMLDGSAFWELIGVVFIPLLPVFFVRVVYEFEKISLSALDQINQHAGDDPIDDDQRVSKLLYLKRIVYSAFLAFQHSYMFFTFLVIFLWYQVPGNGDHLEPLTLLFGALAGFMEWLRTLIRQWIFIK
ncbi:hypothetical protein ACED51_19060 [Photobacterium swingsii]|uniref:hypothetical protein n=1 Tax=Photobacterium swingsii TaxID=680026 RepID=UPI00352FAE09